MSRGTRPNPTITIAASEPNWWTPNDFDRIEAERFGERFEIDPAVAIRLLKTPRSPRGHAGFLRPSPAQVVSPELTVPGMDAAGEQIAARIAAGETIAIFCDYDPDGVMGGEALRLGLRAAGARDDQLVIGHADAVTGFGLDTAFVQRAIDSGATMLITVDCGSSQAGEIQMAKDAGLQTIVTDHHGVDEANPADFHLNPHLSDPATSPNTGAPLAWKLAAATQRAAHGASDTEHWGRAMYLAGLGLLADQGSVLDPEHRAFFRYPLDRVEAGDGDDPVPPGLRALAVSLGEDPEQPGGLVRTLAACNLAKRTPRVKAGDVAALLAAESEEAERLAEKIRTVYEEASPARKDMTERALVQATRDTTAPLAVAHLEDEEWSGYAGVVANSVAREDGRVALVFCDRADGAAKFSLRTPGRDGPRLGALLDDDVRDGILAVCGEAGAMGGHEAVVSGSCDREQIPAVTQAIAAALENQPKPKARQPWTGPEAYLCERNVAPERLERIERDTRRLAPFSWAEKHRPVTVSVQGRLGELTPDQDDASVLRGQLMLSPGIVREVVIPASKADEVPSDGRAEWVLDVRERTDYYVTCWHAG